jgi:hypothetical protein
VESGNWGVEGRESRVEGRPKTGGKSSVECQGAMCGEKLRRGEVDSRGTSEKLKLKAKGRVGGRGKPETRDLKPEGQGR